LRVNAWVSIAVFLISVAIFFALGRRARGREQADVPSVVEEPSAS
jgi:hypothetical protein